MPVTACRTRHARAAWRTLVLVGLGTALAVVLLGLLGAVGRLNAAHAVGHGAHAASAPGWM
jgi:hypothetical protein